VKVLFVTSAFPADDDDPRGVFVLQLARALRDTGVEVHALCPGHPDAPSRSTVGGVPVTRAQYWRKHSQSLAVDVAGITPSIRARPWLAAQVPPLVASLAWWVGRLETTVETKA
jgi:NAD(P)-dependent dehydrogenase (short-subunit alcohol dehydrogenase family)